MNVTWIIDEADGDEESSREKRFLKGAEAQGFRQIKGHRSVGGESLNCLVSTADATDEAMMNAGIRASIYNAVSLESVQELVNYIKNWAAAEKWM